MTNRVLTVENLRTHFATERGRVTAVDDVSFSVDRGETLGIVGESGCGKSVTAESLMRLLDERSTTYEGRVVLASDDLLALPEAEMRRRRGRDVAMIFQDPMSSLNPVFTVGDQLVEGIRLHQGVATAQAHEMAVRMLELTNIAAPEQRMREYPHQLSGGMRQRVMIAMALSTRPKLLIADEPTTALDVTTQAQILDLIEELRAEFEMGTIFITHDLGVVAEVCDRVAVMYLGQIIEETDVVSLFDKPLHPYTRGLLASTPALEADPSEELGTIPGRVPTLHNVPSGCRFADRCAHALDSCRDEAPVLEEIEPGHTVRCLRAGELAGVR
ncbi:ABC transporter ATP-binding protein [Pseudonocardia sp. DSM 110487]|uniref:ABC transporter ATP-binding protein n=1 Tax=Pseudonocardia sp. DSM 110487 TaxID=2865833 RepID=UPI0021055A62|nr:ABC transporter ATP-binding protein [Pseudonocardia sp. DSM 110487]